MSTEPPTELLADDDELWACGRPISQYKGAFPRGFLKRVNDELCGLYHRKTLFPFGGATPDRDNWHINDLRMGEPVGPEDEPLQADSGHDARDLPDEWTDTWPVVVSDPPYGERYAHDLYGLEYARPGEHLAEASRAVKPGGHVLVLDQLVYNLEWCHDDHPLTREAIVGVTTGPGMRIRALNVLRKPGRLPGVSQSA